MKILVCGCGRIGAPLLSHIAWENRLRKDVEVHGVDVNESIHGPLDKPLFKEYGWDELCERDMYYPPYISGYSDLGYGPFDVIIITCGTPIDNNAAPDTSQVFAAIDSLVSVGAMSDDTLIIMRSTLAVGYTNLIINRINEKYRLFPEVVMAPERIAEGYTFSEITSIPQIIGFETGEAGVRAQNFFEKHFGSASTIMIPPKDGGTKGAELAKLMCNVFRYVNFALANEFAMISDENDVNFNAVREACNKGYFRSSIPGAALNLGGPCLGKDAKTLASCTKTALITEAAYDIAEKTPLHYLLKFSGLMRSAEKVGILGLAFKRNSDNKVNSLSYSVIRQLEVMGCKDIVVHDPNIKHRLSKDLEEVRRAPVVIVMTEHAEYKDLKFKDGQFVIRL